MIGHPTQARTRAVGRYELLLELGKSPLGSLWLGKASGDAESELLMLRRVQLTRELTASDRELLVDAARWSLGVLGDSVVRSLDVVSEPDELAITSEQHPGETLRSLLRLSNFKRQAIPSSIAARICLDVCRGLNSALEHAALSPRGANFVSGGLLPDSVLVGTDGRTRLLDAGVAGTWCGIKGVAEHPEVTAYRAPEALGDSPTEQRDPRADIFTVGTLLWEMLSGGRRLFLGSSHSGVVQRVLNHPIPPVAGGATTDPPPAQLLELMQRALERDPNRRFPTLSSVTQALLGQNPAEPDAVAAYVVRVAKSALDSRKRVVERALKKASTAQTLARPAAPEPSRGPLLTKPLTQATTPAAPAAVPKAPPPATPSVRPSAARDAGFAPPPLAKPLPLPAHAKLGVATTAGALGPPPPPEPASSPDTERPRDPDPSSSVRAADILRALAVEDGPESEQAQTVRNPDIGQPVQTVRNPNANEQARATDRALSEVPPALESAATGTLGTPPPAATAEPPASLAAQPAPVAPQLWQRPKQDTTLGLGPDGLDEELPMSVAAPTSEAPGSDMLTTIPPPLEQVAKQAPGVPHASEPAKLEAGTPPKAGVSSSRSGAKRIPIQWVAASAAGALLLVIGVGFALSGSGDEVQTKAAVPEPDAKSEKVASPVKAPAEPEKPASPPEEPKSTTEEVTRDDAPAGAEEADGDATSEAEEEVAAAPEKEATATPVARPRPAAPAPRRAPVKPKRKAKRSFIPSGI